MKRAALLLIAMISSCVLPEFSINPALDKDATAGAGAGMTQAGSQSTSSGSSSGGNSSGGSGNPGLGGKPDGGAPAGVDPGAAGGDGSGVCPADKLFCDGECEDQNEARCGDCLTKCMGAESCTDHECVVCPTGCVNLKTDSLAPSPSQRASYLLDLGGQKNLKKTTVSIKLYSGLNQYGVLSFYLNDALTGGSFDYQVLPNLNGYIQTVDFFIPDEPVYDDITEIGFIVSAKGGTAAASQIFIDSISISGNPAGPWDFTDAASVNTLTYRAAESDVSGSVAWVHN